jgi:putative ABC transport system permease protein
MRRLFLKLTRRRRLQRDLETELAFHREMSGQQQNSIPLGNTGLIKEQAFDLWRFNVIENLWRDLLYAARGFRRSPALVISALLSLGLGIGANTTIFSLGIELLFSQPSVRDAQTVVSIRLGGNSNSPEEAIDSLRASGLFKDVAGEDVEAYTNFNDGTDTHRAFAVYTTKNYFEMLGVPMLYGRGFIPTEGKEVAVLSYRFWRKYFHGDSSVIGKAINLDGRACTIVGILPEHHRTLLGFGLSPDIYQPRWLDTTNLAIYARLKPDTSLRQARAGLETVAKRMDANLPANHWKYGQNITVAPISGYARFGSEELPELLPIGIFFAVLLIVVGLVLLIACANVAILLLARGSARRGETAIRLALGVGRARLVQQFLAESMLLAILGTGLGLVLSQLTATLLAGIEFPLPAPIHLQVAPDWRLLLYSGALTTLAIIVCGLLPAWQSLKVSITSDLARERKSRLRNTLVIAQIATSVIILTTGFLFVRNLAKANSISPGFDVRHTIRVQINLSPLRYSNVQQKAIFVDSALRQLSALPGIECVAAARLTPFNGNATFGSTLKFPDNGQQVHSLFKWNAVTSGYFKAMDISLYQGRDFSAADGKQKVVIVNRTFVQRYFGDRQPTSTVFAWGEDGKTPYRVVGVVEGTKTTTIGEDQQPQLYEPLAQISEDSLVMQVVLRSAIPPALQLDAVRRTLHNIDPTAAVEVETMYASIGLAFLPSQVGAILLGSIGVLGLLLATVGLYAVVAYSVVRRTREIGIRMAIGATQSNISRMVLRDAARLTLIGSAIGLGIAFFITRPLAMFLVPGLRPTDPLSFGAVTIAMLLTGVIAASGPMRRAVTVDPNIALRYE